MKKFLVLAGIALFGFNVNAQEQKQGLEGTWWAAGQLSFSSTDNGTTETKSNTIVPIVGYFITPTTTIGLGIGVINSTTEVGSFTTAEDNAFIVQPLVRKYWSLGGKFYMFGQASLPMTFGKDKISDDKATSIGIDIAPGFDYIVNSWMTVETSFSLLNMTATTIDPSVGNKTDSFNFNANPFDLNPGTRGIGGLRVGVKFLF